MELLRQAYKSDNCRTWGDLIVASERDRKRMFLEKAYRSRGVTHNVTDAIPMPDLTIKDDLSLIDYALFVLSKRKTGDDTPLVYKFRGGSIEVIGTSKHGIATIYDYDIVLYMTSHLAKQMERVKAVAKDNSRGLTNPELPPRHIEFDTNDFLRFAKRKPGGSQYEAIRDALARLKTTTISIQQVEGGYRRAGMFSYIGDYLVTEESTTKLRKGEKGKGIVKAVITIPNWIYDGVVRPGKPTLLTLNEEFFTISSATLRMLYRYAKRYAGFGRPVELPVDEFRYLCGSSQTLGEFTRELKKLLTAARLESIREFSFILHSQGRGKNVIRIDKAA